MKIIKITFLIAVASVLFSISALSRDTVAKQSPQKFFIAKTAFGIYAQDISPYKLDAALNFAAGATRGKYQYLTFAVLDSVYKKALEKKDTLTALELAEATDADFYVYVRVNRLHNILRVDMSE